MSLQTPTTEEVRDNIVAQVGASIEQSIPLLPKAFVRVLAAALAGVFILLYRYASWTLLQLFVQHASMAETTVNGKKVVPLVLWGRLVGVGDPNPASRAELDIDVTVLNQNNETVNSGAPLLRSESGVIYQTTAAFRLDAPTKRVTVRAVSDQNGGAGEGAIGNLAAGDVISFANPLAYIARDAVVVSQVKVGANAETPAAYRGRVLRRFQRKPQGGAYADYQLWAEEVAGVANAYPYTGYPGEVNVYVEATTDIDPDGIPNQTLLDQVLESIEFHVDGLPSRRPVNAAVNVLPITRTGFEVTIAGLVVDGEAEVKDDIETALEEYFLAAEPFIEGLSVLPRRDRITQAELGGIISGVVHAHGGSITDVELSRDGLPIAAWTLDDGEKSKLSASPIYI